MFRFETKYLRSAMASNQAAVETERVDQATCCICMEVYNDNKERKPKFLSFCHHTYCLKCIQVSSVLLIII